MTEFKDMNPIDRRKFLGSLLAIGASAGVLGKLGIVEDIEWTAAGPGEMDWDYLSNMIYDIEPQETPVLEIVRA